MDEKLNYSFKHFISDRDAYNDLFDNPFLLKVINHYVQDDFEKLKQKMTTLSHKTSFQFRQLTNEIAKNDNHPKVQHFNAYNERIDHIIRPKMQSDMEKDIFQTALFSKKTANWEQMLSRFLLHHNGEAGVMCPVACTDGLVDILRAFEHELPDELREILKHVTEGIDGDFGVGAQFMTEIQGGSNIPANVLRAEKQGDNYRLYGNKFFCSAIHADYAVVTARETETNHVGAFIVPLWKTRERKVRNNFEINRLKWKLGTSELPSAELSFNGSKAYQIGPLEKGVAIAVGIVLTKSRLDIGLASSAFMLRAVREALQYSQFREVFGRRIEQFPLAKGQVLDIEYRAKRTTAGVFKVYHEYFEQKDWHLKELSIEEKKRQFVLRELILLQKIKAAHDTVDTLRTAISLFGGNGVIEDFSSLPRLFRDSMVNELWEGPRNVLLAQIHRDIKRVATWYDPENFVEDLLIGVDDSTITTYQTRLKSLVKIDLEAEPMNQTIRDAREWEQFCDDLFHTYQEQALKEIGDAPIVK